jgi:hypothetical protein
MGLARRSRDRGLLEDFGGLSKLIFACPFENLADLGLWQLAVSRG